MSDNILNGEASIALVPTLDSEIQPGSVELIEKARLFAEASISENTRRAYQNDWKHFSTWCEEQGITSMPAASSTLVLYITDLADQGRKVSTIQRRIATIAKAHRMKGFDPPNDDEQVRSVLRGIRREKGVARTQKSALITADIRQMVLCLPARLIGVRDRALLLIGFAGGFRRSELVSIDVEDLEVREEGLVISVRRSKTDQEGEGRKVGIPRGRHMGTCPVRAYQEWLEEAGIPEGPVFRPINRHGQVQARRLTSQSVAIVVKRATEAAGLDPTRYAGHSLRAGLVTAAAMADVPEHSIMNQTGHRNSATVRGYIREGQLFKKNAAAMVGL